MQFDCAAILFDLDGVLVDSIAVVEKQWASSGRKHGSPTRLMLFTWRTDIAR